MKVGTTPDHWRMFNARSETVDTLQVFNRLLSTQRCAVPLDGFYEWTEDELKQVKQKQPYYVHMQSSTPMWVAGLHTACTDETGALLKTFTLITRDTGHTPLVWLHDRMPVMLDEEGLRIWLMPRDGENPLGALQKRLDPASTLAWRPVSKKMSKMEYQVHFYLPCTT